VTLNQLELLVSIADRGSVSATADFFGITQPTVSHQVQQLEEELGAELLRRKSRGMDLTEAGKVVVDAARSIIKQTKAIPGRVQDLKGLVQGSVTLGLSPVSPVSTYHFPTIYQMFRDQYPEVSVSVLEEGSAELVEHLHDGLVDLAIMSLPVLGSRVDITPLWREELVLIDAANAPSDDRLHPLEFFRDRPWILFRAGFGLTRTVSALCQTAGFDPKPAAEASSLSAVIGFVISGLGVSIVPREAALEHERSGRVKILPVTPAMSRIMALVTSSDAVLTPAGRSLANVIWSYSRQQEHPEAPPATSRHGQPHR
jgi:LysR family hydrogen peroxide-inducible transcriptional activator